MIDIKWIRDTPQNLDDALEKRGHAPCSQEILRLDAEVRHALGALQALQEERNGLAKKIGTARSKGEDAQDLMQRSQEIKTEIPALETRVSDLQATLHDLLSSLPNCPASDVPFGKDEKDNVLLHTWGEPKSFSFEPKSHDALGEALGQMAFETAVRMSGSRFVLLRGDLARLERALAIFMINLHTQQSGYELVSPPLLVRDHAVFGTGQLPKFSEDLFQTTDGYWLISTSEIPLTNTVRETILDKNTLPMRFVAHTPCFRSEAGAAGRDTRGMIRQHQFYKVELVSIVHPDDSENEHHHMLKAAESVLQQLELPYRVVTLCTGDMGSTAQKTYDIEVWLPSQNTYREISSCSNTGSYQAMRMGTKVKNTPSDPSHQWQFVHTLNGSGVAVGRALVAVLENYQQEDGSIRVPQVLIPLMDGQEVIKNHG